MTRDLKLAALFQALADPTRLRILALLRSMELSVGELAQVLGQSQRGYRGTFRVLGRSGLDRTVARKEAGFSSSWPTPIAPRRCSTFMTDGRAMRPTTADQMHAGLEAVRADRAEAARRYFGGPCRHLGQRSIPPCRRQRGRAGHSRTFLATGRWALCSTLAPGAGRMLELFAPHADSAEVEIDRSSRCCAFARVKLEEAGIAGASLAGATCMPSR